MTPYLVSTHRKVGLHRQTAWHQNRKVKYPNVKTSLNFEGEIVTFILAQNWIIWWVLMQYDDERLSFFFFVYFTKSFNYLSNYHFFQFSLCFISRCCLYLSLYNVDRRKIDECGIGKDLKRRSCGLRYYPDLLSKGTEEIHEKSLCRRNFEPDTSRVQSQSITSTTTYSI